MCSLCTSSLTACTCSPRIWSRKWADRCVCTPVLVHSESLLLGEKHARKYVVTGWSWRMWGNSACLAFTVRVVSRFPLQEVQLHSSPHVHWLQAPEGSSRVWISHANPKISPLDVLLPPAFQSFFFVIMNSPIEDQCASWGKKILCGVLEIHTSWLCPGFYGCTVNIYIEPPAFT
jgi:hypothetical protein